MKLAIVICIISFIEVTDIICAAKAPPKDFECYKCDNCPSVDAKTPKVKCEACEVDKKTKKKTCVKGCVTGIDKSVFRRCQAIVEESHVTNCSTTLCNKDAFTKKVKCFQCVNCLNVTANTTKIDCLHQCQKLTNTTTKRSDYGCGKLKCPAMFGGKKLECCNSDGCNSFGPVAVIRKRVTNSTVAPKKNATVLTTAKPTQKAKATSYGINVQPLTFGSLAMLSIVILVNLAA
jgi:hypothetical protein